MYRPARMKLPCWYSSGAMAATFEDQDKFRMTGIFRDVYILHRPKKHLWDYTVHTSLKNNGQSAAVRVELEFPEEPFEVSYFALPDGSEVAKGVSSGSVIEVSVDDAQLGTPRLPTLCSDYGYRRRSDFRGNRP